MKDDDVDNLECLNVSRVSLKACILIKQILSFRNSSHFLRDRHSVLTFHD